ncbi:MAG: ribosomal protein L23 [Alphaproteobacteria bacterium]|jgi:ribosomal protein L23
MTQDFKYKILSTEKSFLVRKDNKLLLSTKSYINKDDVVKFIEDKYDAKVLKINALVQQGKVKIRRRISVKLPDKKKFYVTLDSFDNFEKIEKQNAKAV